MQPCFVIIYIHAQELNALQIEGSQTLAIFLTYCLDVVYKNIQFHHYFTQVGKKKKKNEVKTRKRLLSKERQKQTESEKERRKERKLIYLKVINLKVTKDGRAERAVLCLFVSLL